MTKPSHERRELNRSTEKLSTHELCASELDAVVGGTSKIMRNASEMKKSLISNFPR